MSISVGTKRLPIRYRVVYNGHGNGKGPDVHPEFQIVVNTWLCIGETDSYLEKAEWASYLLSSQQQWLCS
jgi:hypothetical protein